MLPVRNLFLLFGSILSMPWNPRLALDDVINDTFYTGTIQLIGFKI